MAISAANFASGAMPSVKDAARFGTTPGLTTSPTSTGKTSTVQDGAAQLGVTRGGPATFDTNEYNISQHSYPSDLMSPLGEYGGNYVIFYINVATDSKILKDPSTQTVEDFTPPQYSDINALASKNETGVAGALAAPAVVAVGGLALSGDLKSKAGLTTGAAILAGGAALEKVTGGNFSGKKTRLKTAIALHTPNTMSTTYSVNYDEENLDVYAMGIIGSAGLEKAIKSKGLSGISGDVLTKVSEAGVSLGLSKLPGMAGVSKITGLAPNPRKEQIFKHVNFRNFTFDYQFYPRDEKEAQNVLNIIYQFKLHMHPEFKDANNFLYIYPSEFDIFYYNGAQENMNVNRHTSCVLTDMVVNYSPNGQFTAFANGMPTQINMTLTFKELAVLTKETIQDGL
jgi:hypothetical protein